VNKADQELLDFGMRRARLQEVVAASKFASRTLDTLLQDVEHGDLLLVDLPNRLRSLQQYFASIVEEKEPQLLVADTELELRLEAVSARIKELEAEP
jgi:hypothetical protein